MQSSKSTLPPPPSLLHWYTFRLSYQVRNNYRGTKRQQLDHARAGLGEEDLGGLAGCLDLMDVPSCRLLTNESACDVIKYRSLAAFQTDVIISGMISTRRFARVSPRLFSLSSFLRQGSHQPHEG